MKKIIALAVVVLAAAGPAHGQVGTTTGGPLTVAGNPVYGIGDNGDLHWYFHQGAHDGSPLWANRGQAVKVGNGWNQGRMVFKGDPHGNDGVIYRVDGRGDLYWYNHLGRATGGRDWVEGKKVGSGWQGARLGFAAGGGVVYLLHQNGDLFWYRHLGYRNGTAEWANGGTGAKVGAGWGGARLAFAGGDGVIYMIDRKGDLYWYRHTGHADGTFAWTNPEGVKVGNGWNEAASAFSGGDGQIYAMKRDDNLYWYQHTGFRTGAVTWAPGTGNRIGTGWQSMVRIF
ncbi:MAG TPA: tachylectin-related carbohydrate-binding protein [Longimicrobiaceae bacterium]|nr:tachylectin-related carbohydrate-binding protein [Longimicrobiaceae bacterium]